MKAFYSGSEFRAAVEEVLGKINNALGLQPIRVTWSQAVPTAAINVNGTILLSDVQDDTRLPHALLVKYVAMGAHELCHHAYTDWTVVYQMEGGTLLRQLHNAVEDAYIERKAIQATLTGNIRELFSTLVDGMVQEALRDVTDWSDPAQYPFALAVYLRDHATRKVPLAQGLEPIFSEAARRFKYCACSTDALEIAKWVRDQLKALPNKQPGKGEGQPKGQGKTKGQGEGQGEGQEKGQQGGQEAAGDANGDEGTPTPQPGPATAPTGSESFRDVEPVVASPDGPDANGGSYNESDTLVDKARHLGGAFNLDSIRVAAALRYNLKRLFDNSARTEFGLRRATGSVDVNSLARVGVTDRVFKRMSEIEGVDSAVVILLDVSGSMRRRRMQPAVECCAALLDSLDRAQVATCILAFNHYTSVIKAFGDRKALGIKTLSKVESGGGTNDFFAVRYAHKLLMQRREARKVCLVLTDGAGNETATRRQVEAGQALGITTVGVGIQSDVTDVYPQAIQVENLGDLFEASFKQIKLAA